MAQSWNPNVGAKRKPDSIRTKLINKLNDMNTGEVETYVKVLNIHELTDNKLKSAANTTNASAKYAIDELAKEGKVFELSKIESRISRGKYIIGVAIICIDDNEL